MRSDGRVVMSMQKASKNFITNLKKQKRENKSLLFLDNVKIIKDALAKGTIQPECLLSSLSEDEFVALGIDMTTCQPEPTTKSACQRISFPIYQVDQSTIEALADTKTPQKVLCIAYHHQDVVQMPTTNFLVLDGLQDPGNVGTLIRTAKASGFEYVFLVDSVKKSNSKLIRSSVGAVFDNKVFEVTKAEFISFAKKHNLQLLCTDMNGENIFDFTEKLNIEKSSKCHPEPDRRDSGHPSSKPVNVGCSNTTTLRITAAVSVEGAQPLGVVIGNEGQGVSDEIRVLCQKTISIPMCAGIESLNAGVSGAIIMYEINKNNFKNL